MKQSALNRMDRLLGLLLTAVVLSFLLPGEAHSFLRDLWPALRVLLVFGGLLLGYLLWLWQRPPAADARRWVLTALVVLNLGAAALFQFWWNIRLVGFPLAPLWLVEVTAVLYLYARGPARPPEAPPEEAGPPPDETQFLTDAPAEKDRLGRGAIAATLADLIVGQTSRQAMIIALNGGWGSGKSSVMKFMDRELRERGCKTRWVSAWHYDNKALIWQAVVSSIFGLLKEHTIFPYTSLRRYMRIVGEMVDGAGGDKLKPLAVLLSGLSADDDLDAAKAEIGRLLDSFLPAGAKLVIFIDDLDRCSPDSAFGTLEFLREVTNFRNCVFVLGMDATVVLPMLEKKFAGGSRFLEKVLTLSVDLNELPARAVVEAYLPELRRISGLSEQSARAELTFVAEWLEGNPRAVKQLLNTLVVIRGVLNRYLEAYRPEEYIPDMIGAELLRLRYPLIHRLLKQPGKVEQLEAAAADQKLLRSFFAAAYEKLTDEQITQALDAFRHRSETGLFSAGGSLPRTVLYTYIDQPDWLEESRVVELFDTFDGTPESVAAMLNRVGENGRDHPADFVARLVSRKLRALHPAAAPGAQAGPASEHQLYRRFFLALVSLRDPDLVREVFSREALRALIVDELTYGLSHGAIDYVRSLLQGRSLSLRLIDQLAQERSTVSDQVREHYDLVVCGELFDRLLAQLGTDAGAQIRYGAYQSLLRFQSPFLLTTKAHRQIVKAAKDRAGDTAWAKGLISLMARWRKAAAQQADSALAAQARPMQELAEAIGKAMALLVAKEAALAPTAGVVADEWQRLATVAGRTGAEELERI